MIDQIRLFSQSDAFHEMRKASSSTHVTRWGLGLDAVISDGEIIRYRTEWNGLRIQVSLLGIHIMGSLHTFFKGSNGTDFTASEVLEAIRRIEERLEIEAGRLEIRRMEFGLNLSWPEEPTGLLRRLKRHKHKEFTPMLDNGAFYGVKSYMSEYRLKVYDKAFQMSRKSKPGPSPKGDIIRAEIEYRKTRKIPVAIRTLADLRQPETFHILHTDLLGAIASITLSDHPDFFKVPHRLGLLWAAGQYEEFWKAYKARSKSGYKKARGQFNRLLKSLKGARLEVLEEALRTKFRQLVGQGPPYV